MFEHDQTCNESGEMENSVEQDKRKSPVIEVDERQLRAHVSEIVPQSVE